MARVTVVDDTPEFLDLVDEILRGDGHDTTLVDARRDGALHLIRQSRPDLLMIDVRIGGDGVDGWAIAQEVRARSEFDGLPFLLCSADKQVLSEIGATLAPARHVAMLPMPFEIDELIEVIDRLLDEAVHPHHATEGQPDSRQTAEEGVGRQDIERVSNCVRREDFEVEEEGGVGVADPRLQGGA